MASGSPPQQSCSFLVVALRENIERVPCPRSSPARSTQLKKPWLCVEDGAPHYKYGQSGSHKGKQSVPGETMLSVWMGPPVSLGHEKKGNECGAALLNVCLSFPFFSFFMLLSMVRRAG